MNQDRPMRTRLINGVASALMFTAAVATVGALERVGQTNTLGLALASTVIVAGAVGFPSILAAMLIIRPETLVRWHRAGFRRYWRWKSRARGGRPQIGSDLRALIRRMSIENPLWGAPRIHGGTAQARV